MAKWLLVLAVLFGGLGATAAAANADTNDDDVVEEVITYVWEW